MASRPLGIFLLLFSAHVPVHGRGVVLDSQGPILVSEPRTTVEFSSDTGVFIHCAANGSPSPRIDWLMSDGSLAVPIQHIREMLSNGSMHFLPFGVENYRHDVHSAVYRCRASNNVGRVLGREIMVKAVVRQKYNVEVQDSYVLPGNTGVLKCEIPPLVKDFVAVTSWVQDSTFNIFPTPESGGKYHMLPTGELLVFSVTPSDGHSSYRCRTVNHVTGDTVESSTNARLRVTEQHNSVPPRFNERVSPSPIRMGDTIVLSCISQGIPPPTYLWFRESVTGTTMIFNSERIHARAGVLVIQSARPDDAGRYVCHANNTAGSARVELEVSIVSSLSIHLAPQQVTVDLGKDVEFLCSVTGQPRPTISWAKDGVVVRDESSSRNKISGKGGSKLRISSVVSDDKGMYQCFAKNDYEMVQASAELRLGDAAPHLVYKFIEQTIQQGPSVSLKCIATGNPTPHFSWTLDGFPLPQADRFMIGQYVTVHGDMISHVNISSVRVEDGGEYGCTAVNRVSKAHHFARLNIYGLPYVRPMGKFAAVAGETTIIKCPVAGFPIASITWEKDGQILPTSRRQEVSPNGTLVLHAVDSGTDHGAYTCTAKNQQGQSDSQTVNIDVKVPPRIDPFSFPANIQAGARVHVTCAVSEGDSPLKITWLKNGRPLNPNEATTSQIGEFDLALRIQSASTAHNGNYTCVASNDAAKKSHTASLLVHVPPLIAPFSFNKNLSEGARAQVTCAIEKGDPPFVISWSKDGEEFAAFDPSGYDTERHIQPPAGLRVRSFDTHSSIIVIERVTAAHSGNYTCVARNSIAEVHRTAELIVRVPPRWVMEPQDVRASEGMSRLVLHCHADGFPPPAVTWRRASGKKPGNYHDIASHEHAQDLRIHSNGSLVFGRVQEDHEGFYLCEAVNGIGAGLSKVVHLTVNVPAHFVEKHRNQTARLDSNASLRCEAKGDHPLKIIWRKSGLQLEPSRSDYRYTLKEENATDGTVSILGFVSTTRDDSGRYLCIASNAYGSDEMTIHLYIQEPPDFPRNLHVVEKGSRDVKVGWTSSQDGNSPIVRYIIEHKTDSEIWHDHTLISGTRTSGHVTGLRPAVTYQFRIYAENELGRSQASDILDVTTEGEKPGGPPKNLKVDPISSTEFNVTWDPPDHDLWNGEILGYHVGYKEHRSETDQYTYHTVEKQISTASVSLGLTRTSMPGRQYQLQNLKKFTRYNVVVQAYNALGPGPVTADVTATTLEDVPSNPPQDVRCAALSSQTLQVSWMAPPKSSINGNLKGYKVTWEGINILSEMTKPDMKVTTSLTVDIQGLEKYTNYSIQILAFTRAGDGVASTPLYCITKEDFPEVPAGMKAVVNSMTSIIVSWLPPLRSNGNITSYNIHVRVVGSDRESTRRTLQPHQTSYLVENLHKKNQYEFAVAAATSVGEGPQTSPITVSPSNEVRASIYSFGMILIVPWKEDVNLACQSVGKPEPSIIWKQKGQIVKPSARISVLPDSSLQISDLHREDSGNYTCYVENRYGSDYITHRLTVQVPPSTPQLHVIRVTSNSIKVQWKNGDNGGAPTRGYILHYKREYGEWEEVKVFQKSNSFILSRLWCGTDYQMYLTAYNRIGMGSPSEVAKATTEGSKPADMPGSVEKFITVNVSWITLNLGIWNDGGCPITHFELEYRKSGETIWTLVSSNIEVQKTYMLSELQAGTSYDIRVRAHNNAGWSVAEYKITTLQPHSSSTVPTMETDHYNPPSTGIYSDLKLIVPLVFSSLAVIAAAGAVFYCFRKRDSTGDIRSLHEAQTAAALDNKQNMEQREQYYATVRKPLRSPNREMATLEKIPEYSEDIYPYATFQLAENVPAGGESRCNSAAPLQTFLYHDPLRSTADTLQLREIRKSCQESQRLLFKRLNAIPKRGYTTTTATINSDCNRYIKVRGGGRSSSAPLHKMHKVSQGKSESEEYDTLGSDSDTEVGTSSRTESSNHLVDSHHLASAADSRVHNFLYHGRESSTSTEPSPVFDRKSLPGRGRPKMLRLARYSSEETRAHFGPILGPSHSRYQPSTAYSNRDQEHDGSGNLFDHKLEPPSGFTDMFDQSEAECRVIAV